MTDGLKSSEFWLAIAFLITAIVLFKMGAPVESVIAIAVPSAGYSIGRGIAKSGNGKT